MNTASVGFHCPECAKAGKQKVYSGPGMFLSQPTVTYALIAINVLVFLASAAMGDGLAFGSVSSDGLLAEGGAWGPFIAEEGEWWRIVTSGFMHFGVIHLAFNMYALYVLGPQLERSVGPVRFGLIYFACLLGGSFGALLVTPLGLTAGASGAIFGLLGVAVFAARSVGLSIWDTGLGSVLLLNFLITFGWSFVSVGGHVGGFLAGLLCGWLVYDLGRRVRLPKYTLEGAFVAIGGLCFVGAMWAATTWSNPVF
jgi:membrane associated rhomboid family serine protease